MLFYIALKQIFCVKGKWIGSFSQGMNVPRVKICVTIKSTSRISVFNRALPRICVSHEIGGCQRWATQRTSETLVGEKERERRERSTGTKLTPLLLFFFTRAVFPAGNYADFRRRCAASRHSLNTERLSFTNCALFPFRSAP